MPNKTKADQHLQDLVLLLEVYGADKNRWPAAERMRLSAAIASDPRAKLALAEAAALDRLLDLAPRVSSGRERALAGRIVAAVSSESKPGNPPPSNVIPLSNARKPVQSFLRRHTRQAAAALLAASLVLGIFAGTSRQLSSTIDVVAEAIGLSGDEPEIALIDGTATPGEEAL